MECSAPCCWCLCTIAANDPLSSLKHGSTEQATSRFRCGMPDASGTGGINGGIATQAERFLMRKFLLGIIGATVLAAVSLALAPKAPAVVGNLSYGRIQTTGSVKYPAIASKGRSQMVEMNDRLARVYFVEKTTQLPEDFKLVADIR